MKEISRRAMSTNDEGIACGPVSVYAVDAEIVVLDGEHQIYLHTQWVDAASDAILFEATTRSIYDCYERLNQLCGNDSGAFEAELANRDAIQENADVSKVFGAIDIYERYAEQYQQLLRMMQDVLNADGINFNLLNME